MKLRYKELEWTASDKFVVAYLKQRGLYLIDIDALIELDPFAEIEEEYLQEMKDSFLEGLDTESFSDDLMEELLELVDSDEYFDCIVEPLHQIDKKPCN